MGRGTVILDVSAENCISPPCPVIDVPPTIIKEPGFCDYGYFYDYESKECLKCHDDCKTCFGSKMNNCITCYDHYQIVCLLYTSDAADE